MLLLSFAVALDVCVPLLSVVVPLLLCFVAAVVPRHCRCCLLMLLAIVHFCCNHVMWLWRFAVDVAVFAVC